MCKKYSKNMRLNIKTSILAITILSVITIHDGYSRIFPKVRENLISKETTEMLTIFSEAYAKIKKEYVTEISDKKLVEAAINGMLSSLDPHSGYMDEKTFEEMKLSTKGEFGGLGIEVTMENGVVKVISPIESTPAARAGIQAGDLIIGINGEPVFGLTLTEAVDKMRGKPNTNIKITISRENSPEPLDFDIKRELIKIQVTRSKLFDDIAYIKLNSFTEKAHESMLKEFQKMKSEAPNQSIRGIILDLRNNPGGLLEQAILVSDSFLNKGVIVSTKGREEENVNKFEAGSGDIAKGIPMVVLINNGSASASEIVAGALQDHKRAIILGTKSFGKGSVQSIIPLSNKGAIKLTTSRYYTPNGRSIQADGIVPDIYVEQAKIEKLNASKFNISEATLSKHLENEKKGKKLINPIRDMKINENYEKDFQLARAIDLLKAAHIFKTYGYNHAKN